MPRSGTWRRTILINNAPVAWPHEPAVVDYHATEGHSWRIRLSGDGARVVRLPPDAERLACEHVSLAGLTAGTTVRAYARALMQLENWTLYNRP